MSKLVNISCCLDPSIRDCVLSSDECRSILLNTYNELRKSRYANTIFAEPQPTANQCDNSHSSKTEPFDTDPEMQEWKRLRLSLIQKVVANSA